MYNIDRIEPAEHLEIEDLLASRISNEKKDCLRRCEAYYPGVIQNYFENRNQLEVVQPSPQFNGEKEWLKKIYYSRSKIVRDFKGIIKANESLTTCPYCQIDLEQPSIDHFLALDNYPEFAIYADNLIPSCTTCNSIQKGTHFLDENGRRMFFNPYFDDVREKSFLSCIIAVGATVEVNFTIGGNDITGRELELLQNHFLYMNLAKRYRKVSQKFVKSRVTRWERILNDFGMDRLRGEIENEYNNNLTDYGTNYWQTALLRAALLSEPFCNRGFLLAFHI